MSITLFDDEFLRKWKIVKLTGAPLINPQAKESSWWILLNGFWLLHITLIYYYILTPSSILEGKITFTVEKFTAVLNHPSLDFVVIGFFVLVLISCLLFFVGKPVYNYTMRFSEYYRHGLMKSALFGIWTLAGVGIISGCMLASLSPFYGGISKNIQNFPMSNKIIQMYKHIQPYHIVNSYGLFR